MFNACSLLASLAILFYVLKFRVHVHVTYTSSSRGLGAARKRGRMVSSDPTVPRNSGPVACQSSTRAARQIPDSVVWGDIASGLVNLGAPKRKAEVAAQRAVEQHPDASFEIQFSVALQEVRAA
jgi:hypothetical protein